MTADEHFRSLRPEDFLQKRGEKQQPISILISTEIKGKKKKTHKRHLIF